MIISWFTQPPGKFASYYQYDTRTGEFSRTRLELGRNSPTSTNDTFVSYYPKRAVGFSEDSYPTKNLADWKVNSKGELLYKDSVLPSTPSPDSKGYDTSDPTSFVHRSKPVTEEPQLPPGIEAKHLTLLANDALVSGKRIPLTGGSAQPAELVAAIKKQVCRVLDTDDFATITDDMILTKLTSQAEIMSGLASHESVFNMDKALTTADDVGFLISEQIEEGLLTPTKEFEDAFITLQSALTKAQDSSGDDASQALSEIGKAQKALNMALDNIDAAKYEAVTRELGNASESLTEAEQYATDWRTVEMEYEPLTDASTVDDYMESMDYVKEGGI